MRVGILTDLMLLQTSSFHFPRGLFHFYLAPREGQDFLQSQQFFLPLNCKGVFKSWQPAVLAKEENLPLAETVKDFCNMQLHSEKSDKNVCDCLKYQQYQVCIWLTEKGVFTVLEEMLIW